MVSQEQRRKRGQQWYLPPRRPGRRARRSERLTDEYIESLVPEEKEYSVVDLATDNDFDRLILRVRPTGSKTFYYRRLGEGNKRKVLIGPFGEFLTHEARGKVREISRLLENGGRLTQFVNSRSGQTVRDAFSEYIRAKDFSEKWRARTKATFETHLLPRIGDIHLPAITFDDLQSAIKACSSDYQKRQRHGMLSAFNSWCVKTGRVESNLLKGRPSPPRPRRVREPLEIDQWELFRIWDACDQLPGKWPEAVRLAIAQGKPISEVLETRGFLTSEQAAQRLRKSTCFADAYRLQVAGGKEGYVFTARGKDEPLQYQSRVIKILRSQMPMWLEFSMGDIVRGSIKSLAILRDSKTQWDEIHPEAVRYINPPKPDFEEVEI